MPRNLCFLIIALFFTACLDEPKRVVQYEVDCIHCKVGHLDSDGVNRRDTVKNGFILRFEMDVDQKLELDATSVVNDPAMKATILVDTEVLESVNGSGNPQRATISTKVPGRDN